MILWRIMGVCLFDLPHRVRHEVDLDVVEPDAFVFAVRPGEAAVVGLVGDLDHRSPSLVFPAAEATINPKYRAAHNARQMRRNPASYVQFVSSRRTVCPGTQRPRG